MTQPQRSVDEERRVILERLLNDLVEQTYTVFESRGQGRLIRREWIEYWLKQGKTPVEVATFAGRVGAHHRPDAHLGGRR